MLRNILNGCLWEEDHWYTPDGVLIPYQETSIDQLDKIINQQRPDSPGDTFVMIRRWPKNYHIVIETVAGEPPRESDDIDDFFMQSTIIARIPHAQFLNWRFEGLVTFVMDYIVNTPEAS